MPLPKKSAAAVLMGGVALVLCLIEAASAYTRLIPEQHAADLGFTLPELDGRNFPQINIERAEDTLRKALADRLDGMKRDEAQRALQKLGFVCESGQCLHGRLTWQGSMHFSEFINTVFFVRLSGTGPTIKSSDVRVSITSQGYSRHDR